MPSAGAGRPVALRLSRADLKWVDERALAEGFTIRGDSPNRSRVIRLALAYAQLHMPEGWRPPADD